MNFTSNLQSKNRDFHIGKTILHICMIIYLVVTLSPLVIVLSSSLRLPNNNSSPLILFNQISLESYRAALGKMDYFSAFINSILTTAGSVVVVVIFASMAAYPISRIKNKLSRFLYLMFIAGLVVPGQMVIIPIAQTFNKLNIPSTRFTPMLMFITCSLPFSVFLYTGFMKSVPVEIEESAYLDGASLPRRFFQIVFPLIKSATISVIITQGIWIWNDYFYPMIFITKSAQFSLPISMLGFLGDKENPTQWNMLFAACILCALPLIAMFAALQKHFVSGIAAGAVKG